MLTYKNNLHLNFATAKEKIRHSGFAYVTGTDMGHMLKNGDIGSNWCTLADSWHNLGLDSYMADGSRYRRRRFAAFSISSGKIRRKPHQPHFQSRDHNKLNGGLERWFEPIEERVCSHPYIKGFFSVCGEIFSTGKLKTFHSINWHAEMHQFRIEAAANTLGCPTPEGLHRDGVDWVGVMLIDRKNIQRGTTEIFDVIKHKSSNCTLINPLDTVFLDDTRVRHCVTPISRSANHVNGYRDVLVLTFRQVLS